MIGIEEIGSYVPVGRISNLDRLAEFGVGEEFVREKIGVPAVARKGQEEETSDLCVRAFAALAQKAAVSPRELDCLVVCTQNPDGHGLPHTAAVVHGKLGCPDGVAAFDISLGCSGYVYGLAVVTSFMCAHRLRRGLLFTADPYSKIIDPCDKNTAMLFSDAAAVTLLGPDPLLRLRAARFATRGADGDDLRCAGGRLEMNGRAIFNFSMTAVPPQIRALLAEEGLAMEEIDRFVLHQGSKYLLDTLGARLGLPAERVPTNLEEVGNTVSSSIPLLLERDLHDASCRRILICGFGVGLSWATAILERTPGTDGAHDAV